MKKIDTYEIVTNRIIASLESGTIPWRKPWNSSAPKNIASKKEYRGVNRMLLALDGHASPYWGTFKQFQDIGGTVRKGEKSTAIVFWKFLQIKKKESEDEKQIPLLRYYNVFNAEQIDFAEGCGVPSEEKLEFSPIEACEAIVSGYIDKPSIHDADSAYYSPSLDTLGMPLKTSFHGIAEYYTTLFHELVHSTGHMSRLKRFDSGAILHAPFGSETYSKEELCAEIGASFLAYETGIDASTSQNSDAYIAGWLKVLKGDKKFITLASAQAQKAVDHIKGVKFAEVAEVAELVEVA